MSRQGQVPLGCQQILHQPVGRGEEHRPARLHQPVAQGAQGVCFPGAGKTEGQDVDAAVDEAAVGQFPQLLSERQRHPVVLEGFPGLARRQPGRGAQPADAPLPAVLGLLLQYFQESLQGVAVAGCSEAGHRLRTHGGQPELVAQLPDPLLYGHCVRHQGVSSQGVQHQATSASRES